MTQTEYKFRNRELRDFKFFPITEKVDPKNLAYFIESVDQQVMEWLKDGNAYPALFLSLMSEDGSICGSMKFQRAEISIKSAANCWQIWHIATSHQWDKMYSIRLKEIGINDFNEADRAHNEVRGDDYSTEAIEHWQEIQKLQTQQAHHQLTLFDMTAKAAATVKLPPHTI